MAALEPHRQPHQRRDPGGRRRRVLEELVEVTGPLVTFDYSTAFVATGEVLVSTSTLRFRSRDEVLATLAATGFVVEEVRDALDRPGRELVFVARRVS